MIGGLAESRYLSMDKLKTRGVYLLIRMFRLSKEQCTTKVTCLLLVLFLQFINTVTKHQCIL